MTEVTVRPAPRHLVPEESTHELLRELCDLPHRGSTTREETAAADWVTAKLYSLGLDPRQESFRAPTSFGWSYLAFNGAFLALALLAPMIPGWTTPLLAVLCLLFVLEQASWLTLPAWLQPSGPSQNIEAVIAPRGEAKRTLVISAHLDTSRSGPMFDPNLVEGFRLAFLVHVLSQYALLTGSLIYLVGGAGFLPALLVRMASLYIGFTVVLLLAREITGKQVNGANDNGSGVACVLTVAKNLVHWPLEKTRVHLLFTGAEEVGMCGMKQYLAKNARTLPADTEFLVLDNVGAGRLHYGLGEGTMLRFGYSPRLVHLAATLASERYPGVRPMFYSRAYFDALVPASRGYGAMTLYGADPKTTLVPRWHWPTDDLDHIEPGMLERTTSFTTELLRAADRD